jgi:predicted transcriptional regulator of viral defense system
MQRPTTTALSAAVAVFERSGGVMRTSVAIDSGIQARTLYWMRDEGILERLSRGVYHLTSHPLPAHPDVAAVVKRVPNAIVCLVSALGLHEVGTQIASEVQIALPRGTKSPRIDIPRVRVFHMGPASLGAGVETMEIGGMSVRLFGIAKTVADCFKYRNSLGIDVAIEALREVIRDKRASPAEIMHLAKIERVARTVRPYIEALL